MSTVPLPAGDVAVMDVAETAVNAVAAFVPNFTAVAPVKPVPVIVTVVPPASGPPVGLTLVMAGAVSVSVSVRIAVEGVARVAVSVLVLVLVLVFQARTTAPIVIAVTVESVLI